METAGYASSNPSESNSYLSAKELPRQYWPPHGQPLLCGRPTPPRDTSSHPAGCEAAIRAYSYRRFHPPGIRASSPALHCRTSRCLPQPRPQMPSATESRIALSSAPNALPESFSNGFGIIAMPAKHPSARAARKLRKKNQNALRETKGMKIPKEKPPMAGGF